MAMYEEYFFKRYYEDKKTERKKRIISVASNIVLFSKDYCNLSAFHKPEFQTLINKYWTFEGRPFSYLALKNVRLHDVACHIHNHIECVEYNGWKVDFLYGLAKCGKISRFKKLLPYIKWEGQEHLIDILKEQPFAGQVGKHYGGYNSLDSAPVFYLKYSDKTPDFMAGVLACGKLINLNGVSYAMYAEHFINIFRSWGIPIEECPDISLNEGKQKFIFISPLWAKLFTIYMPDVCKKVWEEIKNPVNAKIYCPILWYTYIDNMIVKKGIPFLRSRRSVFYDLKMISDIEQEISVEDDKGSVDKLYRMRVDTGLVNLDDRIKESVHQWKKINLGDYEYKKKKKEKARGKWVQF